MTTTPSHLKGSILVTGASGFLGASLSRYFAELGATVVGQVNNSTAPAWLSDFIRIDLTTSGSGELLLREAKPDLILHCAALANVDACENEPERALRLNATLCEEITSACIQTKTKLVSFSTDQLWSNAKGLIKEDVPVDPLNMYGITKAKGEEAIKAKQGSLILRTNFFGDPWMGGESFVQRIHSSLENNSQIIGFDDIFFSPIYVWHLVELTDKAIRAGIEGTFNLAGASRVSKYEFTCEVVRRMSFNTKRVIRGQSSDLDLIAPRPKEMALDCSSMSNALGLTMPTLDEGLDAYFGDRAERAGNGNAV